MPATLRSLSKGDGEFIKEGGEFMKHNDRLMTRTEIKNGDGDSISVELNQATRVEMLIALTGAKTEIGGNSKNG